MIDQLKGWNMKNLPDDDILFALNILVSLTPPGHLSRLDSALNDDNDSSKAIIQFITDLLNHRTKNDRNRVESTIYAVSAKIIQYATDTSSDDTERCN